MKSPLEHNPGMARAVKRKAGGTGRVAKQAAPGRPRQVFGQPARGMVKGYVRGR